MFEITHGKDGELILSGRLDAAQEGKASAVFDALAGQHVVDLKHLVYISSLGLGILLRTQKRLKASGGGGLTLINVNPHILNIFRFAGFDQVLDIRSSGPG